MRNLKAFSYKTLVTELPQILVCHIIYSKNRLKPDYYSKLHISGLENEFRPKYVTYFCVQFIKNVQRLKSEMFCNSALGNCYYLPKQVSVFWYLSCLYRDFGHQWCWIDCRSDKSGVAFVRTRSFLVGCSSVFAFINFQLCLWDDLFDGHWNSPMLKKQSG